MNRNYGTNTGSIGLILPLKTLVFEGAGLLASVSDEILFDIPLSF
jgi:hypothetical protein